MVRKTKCAVEALMSGPNCLVPGHLEDKNKDSCGMVNI